MTEVRLRRSGKYELTAKGHATGSTEVCAAISCLLYAAAGWLRNYGEADVIELDSGNVTLRWHGGESAKVLYDLLEIGFLQLELSAKEYIKVNTGNGGDIPARATHGGDTPAITK